MSDLKTALQRFYPHIQTELNNHVGITTIDDYCESIQHKNMLRNLLNYLHKIKKMNKKLLINILAAYSIASKWPVFPEMISKKAYSHFYIAKKGFYGMICMKNIHNGMYIKSFIPYDIPVLSHTTFSEHHKWYTACLSDTNIIDILFQTSAVLQIKRILRCGTIYKDKIYIVPNVAVMHGSPHKWWSFSLIFHWI